MSTRSKRTTHGPCRQPLSKEEVVALAWTGEQAAIMWSKFCHWLPLDFVAAVAPPEAQPEEAQFDLQEARRRHAIALACKRCGHECCTGGWLYLFYCFGHVDFAQVCIFAVMLLNDRNGVCRILFCKSLKWIAYYV